MSRDEGGHWLPIHTGLLDDERFLATGKAREAWLVLYLQLDREKDHGWFKDAARVRFVLRRAGVRAPDSQIATLRRLGWLVAEHLDSPRLTISGWHNYTGKQARDRVYNRDRGDRSEEYARRPTTRAGRSSKSDGDVTDGDGRARTPRRDETRRESPRVDARGGPTESFAEAMKRLGVTKEKIAAAEPLHGRRPEPVQ